MRLPTVVSVELVDVNQFLMHREINRLAAAWNQWQIGRGGLRRWNGRSLNHIQEPFSA